MLEALLIRFEEDKEIFLNSRCSVNRDAQELQHSGYHLRTFINYLLLNLNDPRVNVRVHSVSVNTQMQSQIIFHFNSIRIQQISLYSALYHCTDAFTRSAEEMHSLLTSFHLFVC